MPQQLANLGSFFGGTGGKDLLTAAGIGSNVVSGIQNFQQQNRYNNAQSYLNGLITDPAKYQAALQKYTQPLNQGLVTAITNQTNAQLAERGLGGSSAITQATLAQALAPYILQNQQNAQGALQTSLGMIPALRPTGSPGQNFTDITKLLAQLRAPKDAGGEYGTPGAAGDPSSSLSAIKDLAALTTFNPESVPLTAPIGG